MPELPDLQVVTEVLQKYVRDLRILRVQVIEPLVLRCVAEDAVGALQGNAIEDIRRRGKFVIFDLLSSFQFQVIIRQGTLDTLERSI